MREWLLPRDPDYFLTHLGELELRIRDAVRTAGRKESIEGLASAADTRGDTIFRLDLHAERILEAYFAAWGEELPVLLVAEGFPANTTHPHGTALHDVAFTCIVDPIDGTRGLMYQKRSAWALAGIAPAPSALGRLPNLNDIALAMQTELPPNSVCRTTRLWAVANGRPEGEIEDLATGASRPFQFQPSEATTLRHGFATIVKFFPGTKMLAAEIEERLFAALLGPAGETPDVFDDQYISSGGQLFEVMAGHDRFVADLRPVLLAATGQAERHLCAHPYDLCTELIARQAGVIVSDGSGPLRYPLDTETGCTWIAYANPSLYRAIAPVLQRVVKEVTGIELG